MLLFMTQLDCQLAGLTGDPYTDLRSDHYTLQLHSCKCQILGSVFCLHICVPHCVWSGGHYTDIPPDSITHTYHQTALHIHTTRQQYTYISPDSITHTYHQTAVYIHTTKQQYNLYIHTTRQHYTYMPLDSIIHVYIPPDSIMHTYHLYSHIMEGILWQGCTLMEFMYIVCNPVQGHSYHRHVIVTTGTWQLPQTHDSYHRYMTVTTGWWQLLSAILVPVPFSLKSLS